jgi:hypothetical protein
VIIWPVGVISAPRATAQPTDAAIKTAAATAIDPKKARLTPKSFVRATAQPAEVLRQFFCQIPRN